MNLWQIVALGLIGLIMILILLILTAIAIRLLWDKLHQIDGLSFRRWIKLRIKVMKGWRR